MSTRSRLRRMIAPAVLALLLALASFGCSIPIDAPVVPPLGFVYTHFKAPLILPGDVSLDFSAGEPHGQQTYFRIPMPYIPADFALGHADIRNAVREAGIDRLIHADYEYRSIFGYFQTFTVHAYGYTEP